MTQISAGALLHEKVYEVIALGFDERMRVVVEIERHVGG